MFEGLFQPVHLLIILVIALVFFGPGKLPELGADLGKSIREFRKAMAAGEEELNKGLPGGEKEAASEDRAPEGPPAG